MTTYNGTIGKPETAGNTPEPQAWMKEAEFECLRLVASDWPKSQGIAIHGSFAEIISKHYYASRVAASSQEAAPPNATSRYPAFTDAIGQKIAEAQLVSTAIKCKHCGEPMFDNGTVGVHIRFVNGSLLQSQWCDDSKKVFAEPDFAPAAPREVPEKKGKE